MRVSGYPARASRRRIMTTYRFMVAVTARFRTRIWTPCTCQIPSGLPRISDEFGCPLQVGTGILLDRIPQTVTADRCLRCHLAVLPPLHHGRFAWSRIKNSTSCYDPPQRVDIPGIMVKATPSTGSNRTPAAPVFRCWHRTGSGFTRAMR